MSVATIPFRGERRSLRGRYPTHLRLLAPLEEELAPSSGDKGRWKTISCRDSRREANKSHFNASHVFQPSGLLPVSLIRNVIKSATISA